MKILWFTWKDSKNPKGGGAEVINENLAVRLARDGHQVRFIVAGFKGAKHKEIKDGYEIIRVGNRYTVYAEAFLYYRRNLQKWPDFIIEEINTIPFFTQFYARAKRVLLIYQLCEKIWFHQFPFPLSLIGYLIEPLYLRLIGNNNVVTESESTKNDLLKYGFDKKKVSVFPIGIEPYYSSSAKKYSVPTILSLGSIRSMKRTHHQIKAFEIAKKQIKDVKLVIAGDANSSYGKKIMKLISLSPEKRDITYTGKISQSEKYKLMKKCHLLLVTSVKEGWCLVVTEANSQGTPGIVYNVDGLRDSVRNNKTGIICRKNTPSEMANNIVRVLTDQNLLKKLQMNALNFSKTLTITNSYKEFKKNLHL